MCATVELRELRNRAADHEQRSFCFAFGSQVASRESCALCTPQYVNCMPQVLGRITGSTRWLFAVCTLVVGDGAIIASGGRTGSAVTALRRYSLRSLHCTPAFLYFLAFPACWHPHYWMHIFHVELCICAGCYYVFSAIVLNCRSDLL